MKVVQAFPCRCRFADKENAPKVEEEVPNVDLSFVIIFFFAVPFNDVHFN